MKKKLLFMALMAFVCLTGFAQTTANPVPNLTSCNYQMFDLTMQNTVALGGQDPNNFSVTYFLSQADANAGVNPIVNAGAFYANALPQTIYLRVDNNLDGTFDTTTFGLTLIVVSSDYSFDKLACGSYTLPPLNVDNYYYTGPNATGTIIPEGTAITTTQTIYITKQVGNCIANSYFLVTIADPDNLPTLNPLLACDENNDGVTNFITEYLWGQIFDNFGSNNGIISVHGSEADAQNGVNQIFEVNVTAGTPGPVMVYVRLEAIGCTLILPAELITVPCVEIYNNTISGYVRLDNDGDGCTATDAGATNFSVYYTVDNQNHYTYVNSDGFYILTNVPDGVVNVYVTPNPQLTASVTPANYTLTLPGNIENINFCLSPPVPFTDVRVGLYPTSAAVPGFEASYVLYYFNQGSLPASGEVTISYDSTKLTFTESAVPMVQSGNTLTLSYSDLQPFGAGYVSVFFQLVQPPALQIGDTLTYTTTITPLSGDVNPDNNVYVLNTPVVNSYDPNDITVAEGDEITLQQAGKYLTYRVRFQNEGTYMATNVRIEGLLDDNLDWSTFEPIAASADYHTYREGNTIKFVFDDINLPSVDTDEAGSQGYVIYRVKPKATVAVGDTMEAQANIFFDFNTAVPTNIATTTIVEETAGIKYIAANSFVIYPNPAQGRVTLQLQNAVASASVTITDVLGKTVQTATVNGTKASLDVSALKSGVYFVSLNANGKLATRKLVIK